MFSGLDNPRLVGKMIEKFNLIGRGDKGEFHFGLICSGCSFK
jgi:hypothetical protein